MPHEYGKHRIHRRNWGTHKPEDVLWCLVRVYMYIFLTSVLLSVPLFLLSLMAEGVGIVMFFAGLPFFIIWSAPAVIIWWLARNR